MCGIVSRVVPGGKRKQEDESARVRDMWSGARREEIQTMLRFPFRDGEVHRCAGQTMERGMNQASSSKTIHGDARWSASRGSGQSPGSINKKELGHVVLAIWLHSWSARLQSRLCHLVNWGPSAPLR